MHHRAVFVTNPTVSLQFPLFCYDFIVSPIFITILVPTSVQFNVRSIKDVPTVQLILTTTWLKNHHCRFFLQFEVHFLTWQKGLCLKIANQTRNLGSELQSCRRKLEARGRDSVRVNWAGVPGGHSCTPWTKSQSWDEFKFCNTVVLDIKSSLLLWIFSFYTSLTFRKAVSIKK